MQTILMLGGSRQQVIAIRRARELGYRTVLCDYLPDNPGQDFADVFYQVSTTSRAEVLEISRREHVDGVLAYASDPAAPTAAYVSELLDLPTNPLRSVEILSSKNLFRAHLRECGFPCPLSVSFPRDERLDEVRARIEGMRYPLLVKPTDSSGSKGVSVISSPAELEGALAWAGLRSRNGILIAEEYLERSYPRLIGGDIFVVDGVVEFWGLMDCLRDRRVPLVPVGKTLPSNMTPQQEANVKKALQDLVTSLGLRFGEMNVEVIIAEDDVPYIIELGSRAGGNMIPVMLSDVSGMDLVSANIEAAMGKCPADLTWDTSQASCAYMSYVLHSLVPGAFSRYCVPDDLTDHIYREVLYKRPGGKVSRFDGADKAVGILFMRFDEREQMERLVERHSSLITVEVD